MTNDLLHSNIHLIRYAIDRVLMQEEVYLEHMDRHTKADLEALRVELQKQKALGDSP